MTSWQILLLVPLTGLALHFVLSKCWLLAPYPVGWLMMIPNIIYETIEIRGRVKRLTQDVLLFVLLVIGFCIVNEMWAGLAFAVIGSAAWIGSLLTDIKWRSDIPATQMKSVNGLVPLPIPQYIVNLRGPILHRGKSTYELGQWPVGLRQSFELIILNPGTVRPQLPLKITCTSGTKDISVAYENEINRCPEPGSALRQTISIQALKPGAGGYVQITVQHGDRVWSRQLRLTQINDPASTKISRAEITRWKFGASGGFVWRGDHDLYDPSTFQSADGLRKALGLAARYRMPTTVMLSTRLSLEETDHREFCEHFGWDRHSEEIPSFIKFLKNEVDTQNEQDFPTSDQFSISAEIGNHMHLHYATHAAADPNNEWKSHTRVGYGNYHWMVKHPCTSLEEQRDNILRCAESLEEHLGIKATCFTVPGDMWDKETPRACAAAGIEISCETNMSKLAKLISFPKEHHPPGCEDMAEMTRMLPRDPVNGSQLAMLKFWVGFARRKNQALVYLAHHHLVMYQSNACYCLTAELLRHVLEDTEGDVYCGTLTAVGRYWRDVLSPQSRKIEIETTGRNIVVRNRGDRDLTGVPLEIEFASGARLMLLINIPANQEFRFDLTEPSSIHHSGDVHGKMPATR